MSCLFVVWMKGFLHHIRHWQHVECAKKMWCPDAAADLQIDYSFFFFFFIGAVVRVRAETIWTTRKCSTNLEKSEIKRRKRNVIDSSRTFVTADFTLLLASGAIWGLFLNFYFQFFLSTGEVTSPPSCYKEHTHTTSLVGQEFTPI